MTRNEYTFKNIYNLRNTIISRAGHRDLVVIFAVSHYNAIHNINTRLFVSIFYFRKYIIIIYHYTYVDKQFNSPSSGIFR